MSKERPSGAIDAQRPLTAAELAAVLWRASQVSRLLSVSRRVVHGWLASGELPGYRLPGDRLQHWRISRKAVVAFCRRHDLPQLAELEKGDS